MPLPSPESCRNGLNAVLDFFFPRFCLFCQSPLPVTEPGLTCAPCLAALPVLPRPRCRCCGAPFRSPLGGERLCQACLRQPPPFDRARAVFFYEGPILEAIHRFKYQRQLLFGRFLGQTLKQAPEITEIMAAAQLLVPVPLHTRRLQWRGFNQALLLAQHFRGIPVARDLLIRVRATLPQVGLSARERLANVKGAFLVRRPELVADKNVVLVDDVFTTGATVAECSRVLRRAGAARLEVVTVARVGYA